MPQEVLKRPFQETRDLGYLCSLCPTQATGVGLSPTQRDVAVGQHLSGTAGMSPWRCWALSFSLGHRGQQSGFPWGSPTPLPSPILSFACANPLLCTRVSVVGSDGSAPG